jgi:hypothetical protein
VDATAPGQRLLYHGCQIQRADAVLIPQTVSRRNWSSASLLAAVTFRAGSGPSSGSTRPQRWRFPDRPHPHRPPSHDPIHASPAGTACATTSPARAVGRSPPPSSTAGMICPGAVTLPHRCSRNVVGTFAAQGYWLHALNCSGFWHTVFAEVVRGGPNLWG